MDNVGLDTARQQPARQPEPVASGLVGDDNALDLARFGAPTIQKFQQCFLVGLELLERLAFDFTQNLEPAFSSVQVIDAKGARVDQGKAQISGSTMRVGLKSLSPGTYKVRWRALSVDTHTTEGSFS